MEQILQQVIWELHVTEFLNQNQTGKKHNENYSQNWEDAIHLQVSHLQSTQKKNETNVKQN